MLLRTWPYASRSADLLYGIHSGAIHYTNEYAFMQDYDMKSFRYGKRNILGAMVCL
jgi:hypothetical protein